MAKKKKIPEKYQRWIDARKRFHLSHAHIQMARELGMNPKKFGSLANTKQEPWKLPLSDFIEEFYSKHFKKTRHDYVRSIEQMFKDYNRKKEERRDRRLKDLEVVPEVNAPYPDSDLDSCFPVHMLEPDDTSARYGCSYQHRYTRWRR